MIKLSTTLKIIFLVIFLYFFIPRPLQTSKIEPGRKRKKKKIKKKKTKKKMKIKKKKIKKIKVKKTKTKKRPKLLKAKAMTHRAMKTVCFLNYFASFQMLSIINFSNVFFHII